MNKAKLFSTTILLGFAAASISAKLFTGNVGPSPITGDYVEARTASVFAGACHYNGELVTTGREAVMAWSFTGGSYNGVNLKGVRAAAAVICTDSLGNEQAARKSELVVDTSATDQQVAAVKALIESKSGQQLGQIVSVRRGSISFAHSDKGYAVDAAGFAKLAVQHLPDDSCCRMASDVWFSPLSPLTSRKVGYTETAGYSGTLADQWQRSAENSAFYGQFSF
jgi:hypothetical protein